MALPALNRYPHAMKISIYHNPRCSKSRQALDLLRAQGHEPDIIEYLKTPPNAATLRVLLQQLGIPASALVRNKEAEYQLAGLSPTDSNEEQIIAAMTQYPQLIERPIVVVGDKAALGRPAENILALLADVD